MVSATITNFTSKSLQSVLKTSYLYYASLPYLVLPPYQMGLCEM